MKTFANLVEDNKSNELDEQSSNTKLVKFISFYIEKELMGINIIDVHEIHTVTEITFVPNALPYIEGVINLRGEVIPVIDFRKRLLLPTRKYDEDTKIIVVLDENNFKVGLIVDKIWIVTEIDEQIIEPPPSTIGDLEGSYLKGMAKIEDGYLLSILDLKQILSHDEYLNSVKNNKTPE